MKGIGCLSFAMGSVTVLYGLYGACILLWLYVSVDPYEVRFANRSTPPPEIGLKQHFYIETFISFFRFEGPYSRTSFCISNSWTRLLYFCAMTLSWRMHFSSHFRLKTCTSGSVICVQLEMYSSFRVAEVRGNFVFCFCVAQFYTCCGGKWRKGAVIYLSI